MLSLFTKYLTNTKYESICKQIFDISMMPIHNSNLDNILKVSESMNFPYNFYPTIHVGGTNGKGSVVTKISSILSKSGYKVGTYSSPHISSFRERFLINNKIISKKDLINCFNNVNKHMKKCNIQLSFFELLTIMSFEYFKQKKVDCAIIEVGLGGDLDATNIINPLMSIITSIGYDHMNILGNTLEEISYHKAGIIKSNIPVILGKDIPTLNIFKNRANLLNSPIYYSMNKSNTYDSENNDTVKLAINILKKYYPNKFNNITDNNINYGLKQRPKCRMEKVFDYLPLLKQKYKNKISDIYLDVGHNYHGLNKTLSFIKQLNINHKNIKIICAFSKGKDYQKVLNLFNKQNNLKVYFLSNIKHNRLIHFNQLIHSSKIYSSNIFDDLNDIHKYAGNLIKILDHCNNNDLVLICGTFFIMKDIRKILGYKDIIDILDLNEKVMPKFNKI